VAAMISTVILIKIKTDYYFAEILLTTFLYQLNGNACNLNFFKNHIKEVKRLTEISD
jgi:hypothetical protein